MSEEKKKLFIIAGAIVGALVLIIVILLIFHAVTGNKKSYTSLENKVISAAKNYYKKNNTLLPTSGNQVKITDAELTQAEYMKSISEYVEEGVTCTATVTVTNNNDDYRYTVLLDCGEKYKTKFINEYIKSKGTVTTGSGLYELNGELVYRGETPNNYIKLSSKMFRIVKISDDKLVLIGNDKYKMTKWDNRYNVERKYSDGINDYSVSRVRDAVLESAAVEENDKSLLVPQTLYIGKRASGDIYNDGSIEKSLTLSGDYYGLLPLYDYINASTDINCMSANTRSCANYNYLNRYDYSWWTLTGDSDTTYKVYRIDDNGQIEIIRANTNAYYRPVITLVSDALYVQGDGTLENPYMVK